MALHSELPIYKSGVALLTLALRIQEQMPRSMKRLLGEKIGGALTWSYVAGVLERRDPPRFREVAIAMRLQLDVATAVVERYGRGGRVGFSGPEYLQAKDACEWMDVLAELVDRPTAVMAADWSDATVDKWAARCMRREATSAA